MASIPTAHGYVASNEEACVNDKIVNNVGNHMHWPFDELVDLSVPISRDLPVSWPGHHGFEHTKWRSFNAGDFYQTSYFTMDEHCGTHCDAPAHFMRPEEFEGSCYYGDLLPLDMMHGPLKIIDVRPLRATSHDGISPEIEPEVIQSWEHSHQSVESGDIVVFFTGWDRFLSDSGTRHLYVDGPVVEKNAPGWPVPSIATIDYLHDKGVHCFGIDTPSMGASQGGMALHRHALSKSLIFVEGLANLDLVPSTGYHFMFLPVKLELSTGCPGRAIAIGVHS
ncbi:MAG TPA: hypothetical protein DEZ27_03740 [Sphaerochaeta sp.]|nr:hypothetical protein [Sphaerochaeta sp.]